MEPTKTVEQYRAELTLPHGTVSLTFNDLPQLQLQIKVICKAENINAKFDDRGSGENTIFVLDDTNHPVGQIATYEVSQSMSVSHLVGARKQSQRAA